ncbi:MAG: rhomboid family intramembrane serine protease [Actinomycetota bacterium]|nr:rhomboid family intramembrane serine protease [Actinomycetota bacterium]
MIPLKDNVPTAGFPAVTIGLIALCVLVFGWQLTLSGDEDTIGGPNGESIVVGISERDELAARYGTSPARIAGGDEEVELDGRPPPWLSPFTAVPVAGDLLHLAINLLFLLIFGRTLELRLGRLRFVALAVAGAGASIGAQALAEPETGELVVGAGAPLACVLGAYAALYPRAGVVTLTLIPLFGTVIEVPGLMMMAAWLAIGLIPAVAPLVGPDLLVSTGLEYLGYGAALAVGVALARPLSRGRPAADGRLVPT